MSAATFRTIELRDANGNLVCEEPMHQPMADDPATYASFNGRVFILVPMCSLRGCEEHAGQPAVYREVFALRCGRAVIHDGQIEGVEAERIVEAVGGGNA